MGKKDERIKELQAMLNASETERDELKGTSKELIQRLEAVHKQANAQAEAFQAKFKEITEHKPMMILNVNVSGVQDVEEICNKAVTLLEDRLEKLGMKDKYRVLALPHTMSIGIVG